MTLIAGTSARGRYHEVEAQVGIPDGVHARKGKLSTLTNELTGAVYFRINAGMFDELTAMVDDPVKLEAIGLSILAIARLHRKG